MNARSIVYLLLLPVGSLFSCKHEQARFSSPPGYNLTRAYQFKLPLNLDEISGVAFYKKDTSVFAINDEKGYLYKLKLGKNTNISRWKFSSGADFEDIVLVDSTFYVLQSNGTIIQTTIPPSGIPATQKFPFTCGEGNEFEILYYDNSKKKLILICKDCEADKKRSLTTFTFDPQTKQFSDSSFTIDVKTIANSLHIEKFRFKPSAAAINPADSLLYIISSVNKLLVITDRNGRFKRAYPVDPALFKQPEGLTFTPSGSIIISNEAAGIGVADILIFSKS